MSLNSSSRWDRPLEKDPVIKEPVRVYRNGEVVVLKPSTRTEHTQVLRDRVPIATLTWRETLCLVTSGLLRIGRSEYTLAHPKEMS